MNREKSKLKKLYKELNEISVENQNDWSKIRNWIAKATPSILKFFPDFYPDFQEICKSPIWIPPKHNSISIDSTGEIFGDPITYFHRENTQKASFSKNNILNFLEGILDTIEDSNKENKALPLSNSKKVFIVHGHDNLTKEQVARFLEKIELEAIILHEQSSGGRTIIEKLEHYTNVDFAVVLLTPNDVGAVKTNKDNINPRARQNVIFELGFMVAKLGRQNVCALLRESVEKPTDYDGVVYVSMDNQGAWKQALIKELKAANIDGNFEKLYS